MEAGSRDFVPLRMFAGLAVQPFVAAALGFIVAPYLDWVSTPPGVRGGSDPIEVAVSIAAGAALVAFFAVVLVVAWVLMWLTDRGPLTRAQVLLWGVGIGNLPGLLLLALVHRFGSFFQMVRLPLLGSLFGLVCSYVFWVISIRGTRLEKRS